jgi:hypothetical protein
MVNDPLGVSVTVIAPVALVLVLVSVNVRVGDWPTATVPKPGDGLELNTITAVVPACAGADSNAVPRATNRAARLTIQERIAWSST